MMMQGLKTKKFEIEITDPIMLTSDPLLKIKSRNSNFGTLLYLKEIDEMIELLTRAKEEFSN